MVLRLERVVQGDDERVIARGQNFLFRQCSLDLISLDHLLLAQYCQLLAGRHFEAGRSRTLHSIQPAALLLSHQIHLSNVSLANQLDLIKTSWTNLNIPYLDGIRAVRPPECYCVPQIWRL